MISLLLPPCAIILCSSFLLPGSSFLIPPPSSSLLPLPWFLVLFFSSLLPAPWSLVPLPSSVLPYTLREKMFQYIGKSSLDILELFISGMAQHLFNKPGISANTCNLNTWKVHQKFKGILRYIVSLIYIWDPVSKRKRKKSKIRMPWNGFSPQRCSS